jgi:hypothetical protein
VDSRRVQRTAVLVVAALLGAPPAYAHHEAMFGPQSSAVLSPGTFLSAQVFDRETGRDDDRGRETTAVFSVGFRPSRRPLSIAIVVPFTFSSESGGPSERGLEDALVSARYRIGADRFAASLGLDESYIMAVGGIEVPTGTLDHDFGRGSVGEIAAALFSVEKRPVSAIGYAYYHHTGTYQGVRPSGNMFVGIGTAWTPIDDDVAGKLFSLQLGLSHERTFAVEEQGVASIDSGSSGLFLHPGVVLSTNPRLQFFALVSLPLTQEWRSPADRQRFRLGAGTIVMLGH